MIRDYDSKNHSKFLLMYHFIFVCKYRKKILEPISDELKQIIYDISRESNFEIIQMETDKDHIHLLIKSEPKYSALAITRRLETRDNYQIMEYTKRVSKKAILERIYFVE
jgi:putative transposase